MLPESVLLLGAGLSLLSHNVLQHRQSFLFSRSTRGEGRKTATTPPIISSTATIRIGIKGLALISLPKATLPMMDPTLPKTAWIPNAVVLWCVRVCVHVRVSMCVGVHVCVGQQWAILKKLVMIIRC